MIKLIKENRIILLILLLALVMRSVAINQSLWLDEAIGAIAVRDFSYKGLITEFSKFDNHPPLYYLDLKSWAGVFGYSEIALRMPSVLYGVLTIYLVYLIARKLSKDKVFPYFSTALLATSQIHIYYSHEARMYAMAAFLATLAVYSFLFVLEDTKKRLYFARNKLVYWVLFSFSITALLFTDYVPVFLFPVFPIVGLLRKKTKDWWIKFVWAYMPIMILGLFWLPTFQIQSQKGRWLLQNLPGWREVAGGATFKQAALVWMKFVFGRISLVNKKLYYGLVGVASVPFLLSIYNVIRSRVEKLDLIWLWLILPLTLGFLASFLFPVFIYFRFLYVLPAFYLIVSWGVSKIKSPQKRIFLITSLVVVNLAGWLIYITDERQQREQWRQAVSFIEKSAQEDEIAIFEYPEPFTPYRWYATGEVEAVGVTDSISATPEKTRAITTKTVSDKEGVYYFEYLRDLSDPQRVVETTLSDLGFEVSKVYDFFPGVGQIYYWKRYTN